MTKNRILEQALFSLIYDHFSSHGVPRKYFQLFEINNKQTKQNKNLIDLSLKLAI